MRPLLLSLALVLAWAVPVAAPVYTGPVQIWQEPPQPEYRVLTMEATAYTWTGYRTATGTWPSRGTVAVDPLVIPLGTELHIEGYGSAVAADTGGDIKGQRVDLYMDSYEEAIQFGRREVQVEVVREGDGY